MLTKPQTTTVVNFIIMILPETKLILSLFCINGLRYVKIQLLIHMYTIYLLMIYEEGEIYESCLNS